MAAERLGHDTDVRQAGRNGPAVTAAGHEDKGRVVPNQPVCDLETGLPAEMNIEQGAVRGADLAKAQRLGHACGGPHGLTTEFREQVAQAVSEKGIVLDDKNLSSLRIPGRRPGVCHVWPASERRRSAVASS